MVDINKVIEDLLKEEIGHYLGDSGGAYGYIYERNREEGILKGLHPVGEYTNGNKRSIDVTIPVYDFLTYNLIKDNDTIQFEKDLFKEFSNNGFEPSEIYEVETYLKGEGSELFGISETGITSISYTNTYNYEEYLSQTLLYVTFRWNGDDYVLLSIHNGCDVRSGYTKPQLFKLRDVEYFIMGQSDRFCQCDCGLNDYTIYGIDDPSDRDGNYITNEEIYKRTYIDKDGQLRCKECNNLIKGGFIEW